jgi:hypothetical protein
MWQIFAFFFFLKKKNIVSAIHFFWKYINTKKNKMFWKKLPNIITIAYNMKMCLRFKIFFYFCILNITNFA